MAFEKSTSPILFGHDSTERIVAVEFAPPSEVVFYCRQADGSTIKKSDKLSPYLWVEKDIGSCQALKENQRYGFLRYCETWAEWSQLRSELRKSGIAHFAFNDPVQQYLLASGKTLFHDLEFDSLKRLQIAVKIENYRRVLSLSEIALGDDQGFTEVLSILPDDPTSVQKALLRLSEIIVDRDPDVIEGHDLYKTILPFILSLAKKHKVALHWGRDQSTPTQRKTRLKIAEKTFDYMRVAIFGRHLVDIAFLVQFYDIGTRSLESFELSEVAAHFRILDKDATTDTDRLLKDLYQTRALATTLSPSYFHQARIFPFNYQDVIVRGNATKIDSLFLREYFRQGYSIPETPDVRNFAGGYTDIFFEGVAKNVWHCDVTSLYPSVMLVFGLFPGADTLGIFRGLLTQLRTFRLEARTQMREAIDPQSQKYYDALQGTFKILINSFYGYLGFAQGHFADFDVAEAVTARGRELLQTMVDTLKAEGSTIIEIDTDGIYFCPPSDVAENRLQQKIQSALPDGIDVDFDSRHLAMFSYKAKNYALLNEDGSMTIRGAALKSRGLEKFQRLFLENMVRYILEGEPWKVETLRSDYEQALRRRQWPVEYFAKTEALQDSLASYQKKIDTASRNRSAAFELAIQSGEDYQAGDLVSYYITGSKKTVVAYRSAKLISDWDPNQRDENIEYYVAKLNDLAKKFRSFTETSLL